MPCILISFSSCFVDKFRRMHYNIPKQFMKTFYDIVESPIRALQHMRTYNLQSFHIIFDFPTLQFQICLSYPSGFYSTIRQSSKLGDILIESTNAPLDILIDIQFIYHIHVMSVWKEVEFFTLKLNYFGWRSYLTNTSSGGR